MRRTLVVLAVCSALFLGYASVASAQPAAKPAGMSMQPAAEMDKVKWMVGSWQCAGKTIASAMGPEHPTKASVAVEMTLDGHWLLHHYREKKTAQNPMPISNDEYWSYNGAEKMWERVSVDNMGGWAAGTAKGWEKGKLVWTSEGMMSGQRTMFRDSFTEKSHREITYVGEMGTPDGKWTVIWDTSCAKK